MFGITGHNGLQKTATKATDFAITWDRNKRGESGSKLCTACMYGTLAKAIHSCDPINNRDIQRQGRYCDFYEKAVRDWFRPEGH